MKLNFDLSLQRLLTVPRGGEITLVPIKAGALVGLELYFYVGKVATAPDYTPEIQFAIKSSETGDLLALAGVEDFDGSGSMYSASLFTNTAEMVEWLGSATSKIAVAELVINDAAHPDNPPVRSQTLNVRVANHVLRGDEGTPGTLPTADTYVAARALLHDRDQGLSNAAKAQLAENLGFPVYASLALANAGINYIGRPFWNTSTHRYEITDELAS